MNTLIIETHNKKGVEWGISLTDHNPTIENYIGCDNYESALRLQKLLSKMNYI
jgi:alpha-D-ribose 1-methylphosphonate 5-triphosphate diphosphatase PhnM